MVRLKNRWLVIRVDQKVDNLDGYKNRPVPLAWLSKREFFVFLNDVFTENFGITYCGALRESKGKNKPKFFVHLQNQRDFSDSRSSYDSLVGWMVILH